MEEQLEGTGASLFVQLMQKFGYNKDIGLEFGTVTSAPPEIKIKLDNMQDELEAEDLIILEHLTNHKRKVKLSIPKLTLTNFQSSGAPVIGATMSSAGDPSHTHGLTFNSLQFSGEGQASTPNNEAQYVELEFMDELKEGDRVILMEIMEGQLFVVLDRVVKE